MVLHSNVPQITMSNMEEVELSGYVVLEWVPSQTPWSDGNWQVTAFHVAMPEGLSWSSRSEVGGRTIAVLQDDAMRKCFAMGPLPLRIFPAEAEGIYLNVTAPHPMLFVLLRCDEGEAWPTPRHVTVSQNEAARWMDGGEWVESCPLPSPLWDPLRVFALAHYRPERKRRVRRNDPLGILKRSTDEEMGGDE
ncbi:MAG TPA: hypothetical protein DIT50_06435 [Rhodocyclaceae bacterium]|nr:hypothetical protein [Rhodocyclaceae bacterium]